MDVRSAARTGRGGGARLRPAGGAGEEGPGEAERRAGRRRPPTVRGVAVGWGVTGAGCWRWRKMPVAGVWRARGSRTPEPGAAGRLL